MAHHFLHENPTCAPWRQSLPFLLFAAMLHVLIFCIPLSKNANNQQTPSFVLSASLLAAEPLTPHKQPDIGDIPIPAPIETTPELTHSPKIKNKQVLPVREKPQEPLAVESADQTSFSNTSINSPPETAKAPVTTTALPTNTPALTSAITPARFDADYLHNPKPDYPATSFTLGEEGKVLLKVLVSTEGLPVKIDLQESSRFKRLDEAARHAVARWRFIPAKKGGEAIEASVIVPIVFEINS